MKRISRVALAATMATAIAAGTLASVAVRAQDTTTPHHAPAHIRWQITVMMDGQQVDQLSAVTAVGQSRSITHHRSVSHAVGCDHAQTAPADLQRTVTVAPLGVDPQGVIGFEIGADETIEDASRPSMGADGCALPPQARTLSARHPELDVPSGQSANWTLLKKNPLLVYRLDASVEPAAAGD
ncbi:hypothetical protein OVY01_21605 [Robbsia sp. Bb-Pol-6]|uniref:Uncharacterized protein n=1 Tax=Robbsia betulipollinis TaxID=2981849 RepID=A0ABT3ZTE3_9BURK|nr:hypothetical protein [Robbsia betulipollinis]MCY0389742.1 hypothetical protein [Robbsia betulipollinis]